MSLDTAFAMVAATVVGLPLLLVGFIAWLAIRKARPGELSKVLTELRGIIQELRTLAPRVQLTRCGLTMEPDRSAGDAGLGRGYAR